MNEILDRLAKLYPRSIDLSLDRVRVLLRDLGDPQERLPPVAHVAGTNGKGSTIAYMRAVLEAAGWRVHVYTSPHLVRFNERIRLAGRLIEDGPLERYLAEVERANAGRPITFFEVTTAAAFLAFGEEPADAVLLETGLGGRLDATNLVSRPAVSVLTPISLDHFEYLGNTIEKIAAEKAGILKAGVPGVSGPQSPEAADVLDAVAMRLGLHLQLCDRDWFFSETPFRWRGLDLPAPALSGRHQLQNAALALEALRELPLDVSDEQRRRGVAAAEWPARLQRLRKGPLVEAAGDTPLFLDGGHNESAGVALADWAAAGPQPLDVILAMRANKALKAFLAPLAPHVRRLRGVATPGDPIAAAPEAVAAAAREAGIADASAAPSVLAAVRELAEQRPARLLVCGSLYLAGTVLEENA